MSEKKNLCENCVEILRRRYYYHDEQEELFEKYWKHRQYKHPDETSKDRTKALTFFKAGWSNALWDSWEKRLQK